MDTDAGSALAGGEPWRLPAHRLAADIAAGRIASAEVVAAHLERIGRLNGGLNALVSLDAARATRRAAEADAALRRGESWGALHGVPVTIKDTFDVAGLRTTYGCRITSGNVPPWSATVVERLAHAGAIVLGHSNVPENAHDWQCVSPIFGRTLNPWNPDRTCGGSSGGGAAAVAAGLSPLDVGSDAAGSLRVPAHFCGVYALKPTENRVPATGHSVIPGMLRFFRRIACYGPIARTVADLRLVLGLIEGPDGRDWEVPPAPPPPVRTGGARRFALGLGPFPLDDGSRAVIARAVARLREAGHTVHEGTPPGLDAALDVWGRILGAEVGGAMPAPLRVAWRAAVGPRHGRSAWSRGYAAGLGGRMRGYELALERRDELITAADTFLATCDAWLCPAAATPAFTHRRTGAPIRVNGSKQSYSLANGAWACAVGVLGVPVVSVPAGVDGEGMPVGLQVVGRRWHDLELLDAAEAVEQALGGFHPPPAFSS
ncbi:MAG TPA: amidase [Longimicrobium sp.]|jgi:amidase|uniref:amidase n=1 Tax=Longimicrobium sp. TaxID=2029185 RepID=UPI002EDA543E